VSGYFALDPRPILPEDTQGTRILLMGALGVTPYIDRALEVLELAERGNDPEHRALVIARDGTVAGLVLFGSIAGTRGGARLHTAVLAPGVDADDVGERLMRAMAATAKGAGARFSSPKCPTTRRSAPCSRCCANTDFARRRASRISIAKASR